MGRHCSFLLQAVDFTWLGTSSTYITSIYITTFWSSALFSAFPLLHSNEEKWKEMLSLVNQYHWFTIHKESSICKTDLAKLLLGRYLVAALDQESLPREFRRLYMEPSSQNGQNGFWMYISAAQTSSTSFYWSTFLNWLFGTGPVLGMSD